MDRYNIINKRPAGLGISAQRKHEEQAASVFNNAFSSDYTGPDEVALCATDHPSPAPNQSDRSNKGTDALSHASLQDAVMAMREFKDDRGGLISVIPDTLVVPNALHETAWELIQTDKKVNTAENNANIHYGRFRLITWPYLTDSSNWFLIDSSFAKMYLNWFNRVSIEFAMEEDFDTLVAKFRAYGRWGYGWSDWVWIYGSEVS